MSQSLGSVLFCSLSSLSTSFSLSHPSLLLYHSFGVSLVLSLPPRLSVVCKVSPAFFALAFIISLFRLPILQQIYMQITFSTLPLHTHTQIGRSPAQQHTRVSPQLALISSSMRLAKSFCGSSPAQQQKERKFLSLVFLAFGHFIGNRQRSGINIRFK